MPFILTAPLPTGLTSTVSSYLPGQPASAGVTKGGVTVTSARIRVRINHIQAIFNFIMYTIAICQPCLKSLAANVLAMTGGVAYNI